MDSEGTHDARGTHATPVPRPAGPAGSAGQRGVPSPSAGTAGVPVTPPRPVRAPGSTEAGVPPQPDGSAFLTWLRTPRPGAQPGVWRFGHRPRPELEPEITPVRAALQWGADRVPRGMAGLVAALERLSRRLVGPAPRALPPDAWRHSGRPRRQRRPLVRLLHADRPRHHVGVGRLGRWDEIWRRYSAPPARRRPTPPQPPPAPGEDPAEWPQLRKPGPWTPPSGSPPRRAPGSMRDVDHARITRAWQVRAGRAHSLAAFTDAVLRRRGRRLAPPLRRPGPARPHRPARPGRRPGADRDRPPTTAQPLRLPRDRARRSAPTCSAPRCSPSGPPVRARPASRAAGGRVAGLQALAGQCAVVVVCAAGRRARPRRRVRRRRADRATRSPSTTSTCTAAPTTRTRPPPCSPRRSSATSTPVGHPALRHRPRPTPRPLPGRRTAASRPCPCCGNCWRAHPGALGALRAAPRGRGHAVDAPRTRRPRCARPARPTTPARPSPTGSPCSTARPSPSSSTRGAGTARPFSLRAVAHHPLRVRVDLPEHGHEEAARLLARLVLAQFTACAVGREAAHFACLVLDDATGTVTTESLRRIQRLRSANAGSCSPCAPSATCPRPLHGAALRRRRLPDGAVRRHDLGRQPLRPGLGHRVDRDQGRRRARPVFADQPMTRAIHALRKLVTGKAVTTDAVTVRQVERERWSASELAHGVPPGHAVLSLTDVGGEHAPPLLVDLRSTGRRTGHTRYGPRPYGEAESTQVVHTRRPKDRHDRSVLCLRPEGPMPPTLASLVHHSALKLTVRAARTSWTRPSAGRTPVSSPTPCRTWRAGSCS